MKVGLRLAVGALCVVVQCAASARAGGIYFDSDPDENPINAPASFSQATALRDLYAPLGVHFDGPGASDGGAILNESAGFGVGALSGSNFLAFDLDATLMDGGVPTDPETVTFDVPMREVFLWVAGGTGAPATFMLEAFDDHDVLLGTASVTTQGWAELGVWPDGAISRVVLTVSGDRTFVLDDLAFVPVPEPATLWPLAAVAPVLRRPQRRPLRAATTRLRRV